jgi:hypothetical protein
MIPLEKEPNKSHCPWTRLKSVVIEVEFETHSLLCVAPLRCSSALLLCVAPLRCSCLFISISSATFTLTINTFAYFDAVTQIIAKSPRGPWTHEFPWTDLLSILLLSFCFSMCIFDNIIMLLRISFHFHIVNISL